MEQPGLLVLPPHVQLTKTGFSANGTFSRADWETAGRALGRIDHACRWWIGDWLLLGEKHYGSTYDEAVALTSKERGDLEHCKWIASTFENWRRRQFLTWSHHREIAALPEAEQDYWLDWAEDGPIDPATGEKRCRTRQELRQALRAGSGREVESLARDFVRGIVRGLTKPHLSGPHGLSDIAEVARSSGKGANRSARSSSNMNSTLALEAFTRPPVAVAQ